MLFGRSAGRPTACARRKDPAIRLISAFSSNSISRLSMMGIGWSLASRCGAARACSACNQSAAHFGGQARAVPISVFGECFQRVNMREARSTSSFRNPRGG